MKQEDVFAKADQLTSWLQDAAGDAAHGIMSFPDEDWEDRINRAKDMGIIDVQGWLADEIYDDVDSVQDMLGDRIADESNGNEWDFIQIAFRIRETSHKAVRTAMNNLIKNHRERVRQAEVKRHIPQPIGFVLMDSLDRLCKTRFGITRQEAIDKEICVDCKSSVSGKLPRSRDYWNNGNLCSNCQPKGGE